MTLERPQRAAAARGAQPKRRWPINRPAGRIPPCGGGVERGSRSRADSAAELGAEAQERRVNLSHWSGEGKSGRGRVAVACFLRSEWAEPVVERGTDFRAVLADDVEEGVQCRGTVPGTE